jgi:hypothetical protein
MFAGVPVRAYWVAARTILLFTLLSPASWAQSTAALQGRVSDPTGAVITGATVIARHEATALERSVETDDKGNYQIAAIPVGIYRVRVRAPGFETQVLENFLVEVGRTVVQDFQLRVGDFEKEVIVSANATLIERATTSVGHVLDSRMVQELPLNGRYFIDLGLLLPGSVTPPQGAFSAAPMRGLGSLAFNTAGNREETVNYLINGITLNNETFGSISFQPSINTIREFKVDNSTFSAEYGQNSGAIVDIATRSGSKDFHGELFEYFRNEALDARNFFDFTSSEPPPFKRNQFGGNIGGPILTNRVFFLFSYEGLRQRQGLGLNSLVLSDAERLAVTDPVIAKLLPLIPRRNFVDSSGTSRYIGSATAPVDVNNWTLDITPTLGEQDRLHGYYALQSVDSTEPARTGNTIPGFGNNSRVRRQILTLSETHVFDSAMVNELRFGLNRWSSNLMPVAQLNPLEYGIRNGIEEPLGLPQINIAGGQLNFGGPSAQPSGRGDTTFVLSDTLSLLAGGHSFKFGGEVRQFLNNNFRRGTGSFNFPSVASFIAGTANSFSVTLGNQSSSISQGALGLYAQDNYKLKPGLTIEAGLRYEWNMTPTERYDRFIVFDPSSSSLLRVGEHIPRIYQQNSTNFQPRVGIAWDPIGTGKTVVRAAYAILVDQPMTSVVLSTASNPPLAVPLTLAGTVRLDNAALLARAAGLAPQSVDQNFENAYVQSWNLNVQRELRSDLAVTIAYIGSKGTHLILRRNVNQPIDGVRPFPTLSSTSPILPGTSLGNITEAGSSGSSNYHALWLSATQRLTRGFQFTTSYTWSKSLDYNSYSTQGVVVQNGYDVRADRGLSDFDARHRFVLSGIYELPFKGNQLVKGWQLAAIIQAQSGNPVNLVTSNSTVNGVANTLRPDLTGPINIIGEVERWFDTSSFTAVSRFGSLGRNAVAGPRFINTDFSIVKNTDVGDKMRVQFRAEFFDVFNHANFGQPGNLVGSPSFGRITSTRFATGESGSSRQIQFALKLMF